MTNLEVIFKSRNITLPTKWYSPYSQSTNVHIVKAMIFPIVMHGPYCRNFKTKFWLEKGKPWTVDSEGA